MKLNYLFLVIKYINFEMISKTEKVKIRRSHKKMFVDLCIIKSIKSQPTEEKNEMVLNNILKWVFLPIRKNTRQSPISNSQKNINKHIKISIMIKKLSIKISSSAAFLKKNVFKRKTEIIITIPVFM